MSSSVEQIKSKIDIASLIGSYIKLEKAGSNFKGRCPFHNEKTPSFFVSPDRGTYYCFGCHAKGDIFSFIQEFEGLDFVGALKNLAERAGVKLEKYESGLKSDKDKYYSIMEQAVLFYQRIFSEHKEAKDYMKERGVLDSTIDSFRIGYAPLDWRQLFDYLSSKNISAEDMLKVGLIKRKEGSSNMYYDTFRGRIMFPILDSSGRAVGFSGRILVTDPKAPKYLNSPDTILFNKSEVLFGLDKAKSEIKIKDYSILVEGQMDLIMLHQSGIKNTVASSGTALSSGHLITLRRFSNRIVMCYDGDEAGFLAANRSAQLALSLDMELKIAEMPKGKDPADLSKEDKNELISRLKNSKHIIDFYVDHLLSKDLDPIALGKEINRSILPYVSLLKSTIDKSNFIKSIAKKTFIKEDALWEDLKKVNVPNVDSDKVLESKNRKSDSIERRIVGIIFWQETLKPPSLPISEIRDKFISIVGEEDAKKLFEFLEKDKEMLLFETESFYNGVDYLEKDVGELLIGLEEDVLKKKFTETMILLQKAEQSKNKSEILKYLEECQIISQKINNLKYKYENK